MNSNSADRELPLNNTQVVELKKYTKDLRASDAIRLTEKRRNAVTAHEVLLYLEVVFAWIEAAANLGEGKFERPLKFHYLADPTARQAEAIITAMRQLGYLCAVDDGYIAIAWTD
ncbi:MAG: hypothetical protein NWQ13_03795 [Glaciimonas sp.]|nr:hypothetical protein [Glaciimonas sp.]